MILIMVRCTQRAGFSLKGTLLGDHHALQGLQRGFHVLQFRRSTKLHSTALYAEVYYKSLACKRVSTPDWTRLIKDRTRASVRHFKLLRAWRRGKGPRIGNLNSVFPMRNVRLIRLGDLHQHSRLKTVTCWFHTKERPPKLPLARHQSYASREPRH